jgi:outer membrane protein assembly factor BamB
MDRRILLPLAALLFAVAAARADDWPQWMGPTRDDVWHETGIAEKFPPGGPIVKWTAPIGAGYAGPAVAGGKVYVLDRVLAEGVSNPDNQFSTNPVNGKERVLCLDEADGKQIWKHEYDCTYRISYASGPRCTPTVAGGKAYTVGAMGNLFCLDAGKGTVLWSKDFKKDYGAKTPMWGFTSHPLVDGNKLFCVVGGEGSVAVAFDKDTGKELWRALSAKEQGYCPPTLIEAGGKRQLLIWDAEKLNSLDPETGKVYWSVPLAPDNSMSIMAPRKSGDYLFASGVRATAVLLKLAADKPAATEVWRGEPKTALYSVNSTPFIDGDVMYGVDMTGELRAVKLSTGERLWQTYAPVAGGDRPTQTGTAFLVKNGDRYFIFNEKGELIIAKLSPKGYEEVSRAHLLDPTSTAWGRTLIWSHPAFADKCVFARNDREIVCASLAK